MKNLFKKLFAIVGVLVLAFAFVSCGGNGNNGGGNGGNEVTMDVALDAKFNGLCNGKTVYLTCVGQADLDLAVNILDAAGVAASKYTKDNLLNAADVADGSIVLLVIGTSSKGLGSAGTDVTKETARATAFTEAAAADKITLVVVHLGGADRRGSLSDGVIKASLPSADLVLVVAGGNDDGLFEANTKAPLHTYSKKSKVAQAFQTLFA